MPSNSRISSLAKRGLLPSETVRDPCASTRKRTICSLVPLAAAGGGAHKGKGADPLLEDPFLGPGGCAPGAAIALCLGAALRPVAPLVGPWRRCGRTAPAPPAALAASGRSVRSAGCVRRHIAIRPARRDRKTCQRLDRPEKRGLLRITEGDGDALGAGARGAADAV